MPMPKMPPGLNDKKPTRAQIRAALDATKPKLGLRGGLTQRPFLAVSDVREGQAVVIADTNDTLAEAVLKISASLKALERTKLNRLAIVVLLHDDTKVAKRTIIEILNGLADLEKKYTAK